MKTVSPPSSSRRQHASASNPGSISTRAPFARAQRVTFTSPCVWWSGRTFGIASSALQSHASESEATCAARLPCVWTAPFGFPVVPLV